MRNRAFRVISLTLLIILSLIACGSAPIPTINTATNSNLSITNIQSSVVYSPNESPMLVGKSYDLVVSLDAPTLLSNSQGTTGVPPITLGTPGTLLSHAFDPNYTLGNVKAELASTRFKILPEAPREASPEQKCITFHWIIEPLPNDSEIISFPTEQLININISYIWRDIHSNDVKEFQLSIPPPLNVTVIDPSKSLQALILKNLLATISLGTLLTGAITWLIIWIRKRNTKKLNLGANAERSHRHQRHENK